MLCRLTTRGLTVLAPAKLNLFLRVVSRRPDGFHAIESVMARIGLYDTLTLEPRADGEIRIAVTDAYPRSAAGGLTSDAPKDERNLVVRAALLLKEHANCRQGAQIHLVKRIPAAAGLGGGSSDCAAALGALNRLWNLRVSDETLRELGGRLGSDVPFFLGETPVSLCTGRGEILEPLSVSTCLQFVVARPASGLATPAVYRACTPDSTHQSASLFVEAMNSGQICRMARRLHNGLQAPAEGLSSDVRWLRGLFERESVVGHQMSGSGTSYFGICHSRQQALGVARRLRQAGVPWVQAVSSCS